MDKALKQRLVGASVLVILAVIVLPMLLSGRSDTLKQESRKIELPARPDELSFETRRFPIETPNQSGTTAQAVTQPEPEPPPAMPDDSPSGSTVDVGPGAGQSDPVTPAAEVLSAEVPADVTADATGDDATGDATGDRQATPEIDASTPPERPLAAPAVSETPDSPRYLVQVASFSNQQNANALAERLRQQDMPVAMDVVDRVGGRLHRVRIGPYTQRSEVDSVVARLRSDMQDLSPRVVDLRPGDATTVSTPSDPLVRWVVQVGSFGNPANAESLVAKLRLAGMSAYSEKTTSGTGTAYKVRVGPEIDRDTATQLARRLKTEHGLEGLVMTTD